MVGGGGFVVMGALFGGVIIEVNLMAVALHIIFDDSTLVPANGETCK